MENLLALVADPTAWAALVTLVVMEVVLGVDNLVFVAIISNKLPPQHRQRARRVGLGLALVLRLALLSVIAFIIRLTDPVISLPWSPPPGPDGHPPFDLHFSWRDLILIAGGLFLIWKATREIHENVDPAHDEATHVGRKVVTGLGAAIVQILALDIIFSIDSILTAVGMTEHLPIMMVAVVIAVGLMLLASDPLAEFIRRNPTVVMLALGFLLMIGATLIADGFGVHVPKGYIYAAMAFAGGIEALNGLARRKAPREAAFDDSDAQE
ncbi:TerC family protein [Caulobacter sp. KR2-114]|uniref:TerC family protein n=1 Tax=Caulobacter sp. KR2-114 TaxID=3400912 RepID=UPI003C01E525